MTSVVPLLMLLGFCVFAYRVGQMLFATHREVPPTAARVFRIPPLEVGRAEGDETFRFLFGRFGVGAAQVGHGRVVLRVFGGSSLALHGEDVGRLEASRSRGSEVVRIEPPVRLGGRRLHKAMVVYDSGISLERALRTEFGGPSP
ncbi:MAG: hypothetical protein AAGA99_22815 [Actinomycetota bacterium]